MALTKSDLHEISKIVHNEVKDSEKNILKKLEIVSYTLDKQTVGVSKRVTKIEKHLNLPQN